ncbi:MAG: hypothetical protein IPJ82_18365 [Lewinellaceae bacterium]|nr:hypothetical protein [Lewinellaceae bacterium]
MFRRTPKESPLDRLEREANDDFRLLDELGPAHFGADHLMELHARSRERLAIFRGRQRLALVVGTAATGWILLAFVSNFLKFKWLTLCALGAGGEFCSVSVHRFLAKKTF